MKTTTSRISQAIDAIKVSLDDTQEVCHTSTLPTPADTLNQLALEIECLQAKKASLLAEIELLEKRLAQLRDQPKQKSAQKFSQKRPSKAASKPEKKTSVVDPEVALSQLKAAFEGF